MRSTLLLALLLVTPLAAASAAHPEPHVYAGVLGAALSAREETPAGDVDQGHTVAPTALCPDVKALDDPRFAVGGGCFPFVTQAGDDTGATLTVYVTDATFAPVYWLACVDVDGDGLCADATGDELDLCWSGPLGAGSHSLLHDGACSIHANPAAELRPLVQVVLLAGADHEDGATATHQASAGTILLL